MSDSIIITYHEASTYNLPQLGHLTTDTSNQAFSYIPNKKEGKTFFMPSFSQIYSERKDSYMIHEDTAIADNNSGTATPTL